jgi:hypothetical protein
MHRQNLEVVANALTHRSDPTNVPDISGMDGIPAQDLQEYKSRNRPATANTPNVAMLKQIQTVKTEVPSKRAKIDTPLGAETIQAQLAEFQKKKEQQEIQDLQNQGILFPPGLSAHSALGLFAFRTPPPGTGHFAAKSTAQVTKDGKLDTPPTTALSSQSINSSLTSTSASASPKFVSKSVFLPRQTLMIVDLLLHRVSNLGNMIPSCRYRHRHHRLLHRGNKLILLVR